MGTPRNVEDENSGTNARYRMATWVGAMILIIAVALAVLLWTWIDTAATA